MLDFSFLERICMNISIRRTRQTNKKGLVNILAYSDSSLKFLTNLLTFLGGPSFLMAYAKVM